MQPVFARRAVSHGCVWQKPPRRRPKPIMVSRGALAKSTPLHGAPRSRLRQIMGLHGFSVVRAHIMHPSGPRQPSTRLPNLRGRYPHGALSSPTRARSGVVLIMAAVNSDHQHSDRDLES